MGNEKFDIPLECRGFDDENLEKRLEVAIEFVGAFAPKAAPPMSVDEKNKEWTKSVRRRLKVICTNECYMCPPDPDRSKGEFLVDFSWAEINFPRRILLAGESEWGTNKFGEKRWDRVEEDFEKLLSVKSPFKVLIFSSNKNIRDSESARDRDFSIGFAMKKIKSSLEGYGHHIAGEVYIFIDFPEGGDKNEPGQYQSFIWLVKKFGNAGEVIFENGPNGPLNR
jgi:hypothetical protein